MDFQWCHGPDCHTKHTVDRIRGTKGSKVLRTKKVTNKYGRSMYGNGGRSIWDYFCNHQCLMDFMAKHTQAVVDIAPRTEALETPIEDPKKVTHSNSYYNWNTWEIKEVDNA